VKVKMELPAEAQLRQVILLTPDGDGGAITVPSQFGDGRVRFTVPDVKTYSLAVIELES